MNTYKKTKLKNGMRVVTVPMKGNPTVTVLVLVEAGSRYESKPENGISHFLEHMCFKGTTKRPHPGDISRELDAIGAITNAFTGEEVTGYWAKARAHHLNHVLEVVSDLYLDPLLPATELEKERGVIIEELNMYEDLPQHNVHDVLDKLMYGEQPAGRTIVGTKENLLRFQRKDFVTYRTQHYVPEKTAIVVAGDISPSVVLKKIRRYFESVPKKKCPPREKTKEVQKKPQILIKPRKTDQTHFVIGFRSFDLFDKRDAAAEVLAAVLGGGMSSRLFHKMREELGICYYIKTAHQPMTDTGVFKVFSGVATARFEEAVREILKELRRIQHEPIDAKELAKAKELIIGRTQMGLEASDDLANWYAGEEILKHTIQTPKQALAKIAKVTARDVRRVARDIFRNDKLNLAVIGPNKVTPSLRKILAV